jgi:hypothetical protein
MSLEMPASVNVNPKSADAHPPATFTRACATATPNGYPELVQYMYRQHDADTAALSTEIHVL